ncbi:Hemicentin-2 Precursor [Collichthys lucidus]|uniref:Hemicentin-2 n=1 Tax=Collichthys lucidus TaxID=240159 RepID=A0A4U5UCZ8_COLLU|nr:Hemicentin-2 Precursor [Collichthys lucidus]
MEQVLFLLVTLAGVTHAFLPAAETKCDATSNTSVLCQVHLGGTVYIQMMNNASHHQLRFKKHLPTGTISVFSLKKEKVTIEEPFRNKTTQFFINNGTLKITNVEKNHSGRYNLEVYDPRGMRVKNIDIKLDVQGKCLKLNLISQHIIKCNQEKYKYPIHEEKTSYYDTNQCYATCLDCLLKHTSVHSVFTVNIPADLKAVFLSNPNSTSSICCTILREDISCYSVQACSLLNKVEVCLEAAGSTEAEHRRDMEVVIGLLLMLLRVCHGVETPCDGRQDGAQCYGALGGTVVLQLMDSTSKISRYQLFKNRIEILDGIKNKIVSNVIADRSSFTLSNGTFRINDLSRTDGGEYTLIIFDSNGRISEPRTLQLIIQAPVSSVLLVSECLSQGEMRVSCSSEGGDSPQYSWTLDGHTLTDTQLLPGNNETNNITLRQDVSGQLTCSVKNHVSTVSKTKTISTCGFIFIDCISNGTRISQWVLEANNTLCIKTTISTMTTEDHSLLICGVRAAVVILILIGIAVYFAWKKKKYEKAEGSSVRRRVEHEENSVMMVEMGSSAYEL